MPCDKDIDLRMMVDSDHAGDKLLWVSYLCKYVLITWMTQKQPMIKSSAFGAEFVAMIQGVETLRGIHYKLRMIGVQISF